MDERAQIQAAMGRPLDGTPLRSDGKLTIVSLAAEVGVKRHILTHKHTDLRRRDGQLPPARQVLEIAVGPDPLQQYEADVLRVLHDRVREPLVQQFRQRRLPRGRRAASRRW